MSKLVEFWVNSLTMWQVEKVALSHNTIRPLYIYCITPQSGEASNHSLLIRLIDPVNARRWRRSVWLFTLNKSISIRSIIATMMKAQAPIKSVYVHCSSVSTEPNAHVWKMKRFRKLLKKNQHSFEALTNKYDLETICNVAKELLDAGIFESNLKAETQWLAARPHLRRRISHSENASLTAEVVVAPVPEKMSSTRAGVAPCKHGLKAGDLG